LTSLSENNLGKLAPERYTILDSNDATMMEWQWHQQDHMQIICTKLQTDSHASTLSVNFLLAGCSS